MTLIELMQFINEKLPVRFTYREKVFASSQLTSILSGLNYKAFDVTYNKTKLHNLMINDVKENDVVIITSYDTPQKISNKYVYYPFDRNKEFSSRRKHLFFQLIISLFFAIIGCLIYFNRNSFSNPVLILLLVILFGLSYYFVKPNPNLVNFNRNNGSVALAITLAKELNNVSALLIDKLSESTIGYQLIDELFNNLAGKKVIILDCISTGSNLIGRTNIEEYVHDNIQFQQDLPFNKTIKFIRTNNEDFSIENTASIKDCYSDQLENTYLEIKRFLEN